MALCVQNNSTNGVEDLWTGTLEYYSTYTLEDLLPVVQKIAKHLPNVPKPKLNQIYRKYAAPKLCEVSTLVESRHKIVQHLANIGC